MATDHHTLRIMLVRDPQDAQAADLGAIHAGLSDAGYELITAVHADLALPRHIEHNQPDLIIIESGTAARDLVEHVCVSSQQAPRPIVLFTANNDSEHIRASIASGITAYIVDGLKPDRVKAVLDVACARFQFEQQLRTELAAARNQLVERKVIERAKGVLMQKLKVTEDEAYRRLRKLSMEKNIRIATAAQRVIDASSVLD
jgi:response regulator NasT